MKTLALFFVSFASAFAFACPDLSGSYVSDEGVGVKYAQEGCGKITRYIGETDARGAIHFPEQGMLLIMDGKDKTNCTIRHNCTKVTPYPDHIEFKLNFTGGVATDEHGSCDQDGYSLKKDDDGNLLADFNVTNCGDKFKGTARKTFKKL